MIWLNKLLQTSKSWRKSELIKETSFSFPHINFTFPDILCCCYHYNSFVHFVSYCVDVYVYWILLPWMEITLEWDKQGASLAVWSYEIMLFLHLVLLLICSSYYFHVFRPVLLYQFLSYNHKQKYIRIPLGTENINNAVSVFIIEHITQLTLIV
jgi:hypothetical protein